MHYTGRTFLSTLTFAALQPFTLGTWIPSHKQNDMQIYDGDSIQVTLPDFGDLAKYVCPNKHSNIFHRQSAGISTVSMEQIREILDLLATYEQSTLTMINGILVADGVDPASAATSLLPVASASTAPSLPPAMDTVSPPSRRPAGVDCISSIQTTTLVETSTTTVTADPVTTTATETITISAAVPSIQATTTIAPIPEILTSAAASQAAAITTPSQPTAPPYQFNAMSQSNVAVYFGQTDATAATTLEAQCADPNTDIVILAFVLQQLDGGAYPQLNFGAACGGQTPLMASKAPGLLYCPELAGNITACQRGWGKKVMLSIGGATSNIKFGSEKAAKTFAGMLWDLFGPPGNVDAGLRPFGDVEVDGFDIGLSSLFLRMKREKANKVRRQRRQFPCPLPHARHLVPGSVSQRHEDILLVLLATMSLPVLRPSPSASGLRLRL
jgi:hypothetical protein